MRQGGTSTALSNLEAQRGIFRQYKRGLKDLQLRATSHKSTYPINDNNNQVNVDEISISLRESISFAVKSS